MASFGRIFRRELQEQIQRNPAIRRSELRFLNRYAGEVVTYAPNAQTKADVSSGKHKLQLVSITETTSTLADLRDLSIVRGRFFHADEDLVGA